MKVLVAWPPHVPSYFNAGHHLPVFSIAAYLRAQGHEVRALDAGVLNRTWKEFGQILAVERYDAVVLVNDFDVVEGIRRAVDYTRALLPSALLMTVGRLSYQNPGYFRTLPLDAIGVSGDYEAGVAQALALAGGAPRAPLPGVEVRDGDNWLQHSRHGTWLPAEQWVLPDVSEIPYAAYDNLYADDTNKFCGLPAKRELVVPVARGCPVNCSFCDVPSMQGIKERRMSVDRTVAYIEASFREQPFEYVSFYAPTFTLRKQWVHDLCARLSSASRRYPWKCATTLRHLDEQLVMAMGRSGCVRVSVGVETFGTPAQGVLPKAKLHARERFEEVLGWCRAAGVELNCFVVVGLPGTSAQDAADTITQIARSGARPRPTLYTPYEQMTAEMSEQQLSGFNRQTFVDARTGFEGGEGALDYLKLVFGDDGYVTSSATAVDRVAAQDAAAC
ncbi:B12-binding domain-containing radical SAM protein [Streptomyces sp. NPDC056831]|uniref:B12-binding domain-containing radical SAM protein n=1 Tax=Streptomyces sp. NPDC056831 TaxID=3345954 RepID=UPI003675D235